MIAITTKRNIQNCYSFKLDRIKIDFLTSFGNRCPKNVLPFKIETLGLKLNKPKLVSNFKQILSFKVFLQGISMKSQIASSSTGGISSLSLFNVPHIRVPICIPSLPRSEKEAKIRPPVPNGNHNSVI